MTAPPTRSTVPELPPLRAGERLDQKTFHARYERMPEKVRAELIGGIVYMPSPLSADHGDPQLIVNGWIGVYQARTPGVVGSDNATVILGEFSEPQPDVSLRLLPEYGGLCRRNADGYLEGPPGLLAEISVTSESYDLQANRRDYETLGVGEYLVILVRQQRIVWLARRGESFVELSPGDDGIWRSALIPGLWLDAAALLRGDAARVLQVLDLGLASPEHAAFVARLRQTRSTS